MRRSFWHRALSAFLAAWLAIVMAEPAALHTCPTHGGSHAAAMHGAGAASAMAMGDAMSAHHGAGTPGRPAHRHQCTCLGQCNAPVGVAAPAALVALLPAVETSATRDSGLPDHEYVPVAAAHVLPFANGPPTSVA